MGGAGSRFGKRLALLAGGLLVGLALAEVGLRIYGAWTAPPVSEPPDMGTFDLLCLGDSFAYGLGAEDGQGPCEHLDTLLELELGQDTVAAWNRAVPGFNSSQTLDALPEALAEARPQLVVLTVGHNNGWNFAGLHLDHGEGGAGLRLLRGFGSLRLVKLAQLLLRHDRGAAVVESPPDPEVQAWFDRQNRAAKGEKLVAERERLLRLRQQHPEDVWLLVRLAELADAAGDDAEQARLRRMAVALDPEAVTQAKEAVQRVDRWHRENARQGVESHLVGSEASKAALFRALGNGSLDEQARLLERVLARDLEEIVAQVEAAGATLLISGYPGPKPANAVLAREASDLGVPYIDQQASFDRLVDEQGDPGRWFVLDGHCTSEGYRRVAENLLPLALERARSAR